MRKELEERRFDSPGDNEKELPQGQIIGGRDS